MAEKKEVTRAELEGLLWGWIKDARSEDQPRIAVARLLHESISEREAAEQPKKQPPSKTPGMEVV